MRINKVFLFYPPGPQYQRGEDRCQGNVDNSTSTSMRAPNDMAYVSSQLEKKKIQNIFTDYSSEKKTLKTLIDDFKEFSPDAVITSTTTSTIEYDLKIINQMKLAVLDWNIIVVIESIEIIKINKFFLMWVGFFKTMNIKRNENKISDNLARPDDLGGFLIPIYPS